ncbi:MAG: hypothetical protein WCS27_11650, partial [Victivallaceae bacterium]
VIFPKHDINTPFGKSRIIGEMLEYFRKISKPVAREGYIQALSLRLGVKAETIFSEYNKETKNKTNTFKFNRRPESEEAETTEDQPLNSIDVPDIIRHAEKTLLETALESEETAERLTNELPPEQLSQTPVGKALNELLNCTLNGEWEHAREHLSAFERENPSPDLSKVLFQEESYDNRRAAKAVPDCLRAISEHYRKLELTALMQKLRTAAPEEKTELMKKLQELNKVS